MLTPADMESLRSFVGSATFTRGLAYAGQGAVRRVRWTDDGACAYGEVQGGAPSPYGVTVIVRRSPSDRIVGIDAVCTCPIEINCKHAVALLLANPALRVVPPRTPGSVPGPRKGGDRTAPAARPAKGAKAPRWEAPLRNLIAGGAPGTAASDADAPGSDGWGPAWSEPADIGLQFELVLTPSRTAPGTSASGIRIRPVLRSHTGQWVRTGISWSNLEYLSYRRPVEGRTPEHLTVLTELLALSRVAGRRSAYSSSAETVWLQAINSRRLWDLLARGPRPRPAPGPQRAPGRTRRPPGGSRLGHPRRHPGRPRTRAPTPGGDRRRRRPPRLVPPHRHAGPRHRLVGRSRRSVRRQRPSGHGSVRHAGGRGPPSLPGLDAPAGAPGRRGAVPPRLLPPVAPSDRGAFERRTPSTFPSRLRPASFSPSPTPVGTAWSWRGHGGRPAPESGSGCGRRRRGPAVVWPKTPSSTR